MPAINIDSDLYWERKISVWNNKEKLATLKDASGDVICEYPRGSA
jgi:hypothetical protein